jgi:triacylglycerol esterase/lipase EstA (alpha/beta hydrolase family)
VVLKERDLRLSDFKYVGSVFGGEAKHSIASEVSYDWAKVNSRSLGVLSTGSGRLMLAMLESAVHDYYVGSGLEKGKVLGIRNSVAYKDANRWIFGSCDTEYIFSFNRVCEVLGLDVECVRVAIRQHKAFTYKD